MSDDRKHDESEHSRENDIPEMDLDNKYSNKKDLIPETQEKMKKEIDKTKKELEKLKTFILKKYPFTQVISILPPMSIKNFIEEEEVPKETEKHIHLYVVIPEENFKEFPKIKETIVKQIEEL